MEPRNYLANAEASPPPAPGTPSNGYPTAGVAGKEATIPGAHWFYKVGESLRKLIQLAGFSPSDSDLDQVVKSVKRLTGTQAKTVTESTVLTIADAGIIKVDASSRDITLRLPTTTVLEGLKFDIVRTDNSDRIVTIVPHDPQNETIGKAASLTLTNNQSVQLKSDGDRQFVSISPTISNRINGLTLTSNQAKDFIQSPLDPHHQFFVHLIGGTTGNSPPQPIFKIDMNEKFFVAMIDIFRFDPGDEYMNTHDTVALRGGYENRFDTNGQYAQFKIEQTSKDNGTAFIYIRDNEGNLYDLFDGHTGFDISSIGTQVEVLAVTSAYSETVCHVKLFATG